MSLILDALKKSDKKREDISAPRLDTVHQYPAKRRPRRPAWIYLLIVVLLLNIGLLLWLWLPDKTPIDQAERATLSQQTDSRKQRIAVTRSRSVPDPLDRLAELNLPSLAEVREENNSIANNRIYLISELPTSLRQRIPPLHMSLHAYSKTGGSASMVRINDQMLREGAQLNGQIRLETINKDGAVLRYEGYRFLVPRKTVAEH